MRWKLLGIAAILLLLVGGLLFTEQGRRYAIAIGSMTRGFANLLGNFLASIGKTPSGQEFEFEMKVNKEAMYGQSFSFSEANFKAFGSITTLNIDGKNWEISEKSEIEVVGKGEISVEDKGKIKLKADASLFRLGFMKTSGVKVEMEIVPESFSLNNSRIALINMNSASGYAKKKMENLELKADFNKANLKIENFVGSIEVEENIKIFGVTTNIEIDGKKI